jgi:V8-like Glu-specific endopeptidase
VPGSIKVIDNIDGPIYYDMDGADCQSGSPIFEEKTSNLVGIHQGYSKEEESSFGTMIGSKAIEMLEQWCLEMMPQFTATN